MSDKRRHHELVVRNIQPSFAKQIGADLKRREHMRVYQRGHQQLEYLQIKGRLTEESYEGVVSRMQAAIREVNLELGDGLRDMERNARNRRRIR